ncbi:zinc-binding dehydrogenase [Amycolatopsis sp. K13G38]|uniref:Zinc-binding dehydrogenase n=1 Tax=Amycolatopsis acididurans TaxID=2724524 RepID=A0ABX1IWQ8_9PSEU|nr:zinc-binding dehydrogenase [Amycolatopsis acididurans]NKQ51933.1 zinc-binding dehydrogenase [Amycolatopsis acididurans]
MRAYVVRTGSGKWSASWEEYPEPACPRDGVVVEPRAAALAWSDVLQQEGGYVGAVPDPPFVSGHEFAGAIVEAGPDAGFAVGERVFGFLPRPAAFADRVAASSRFVRRIPDELTDIDAAAITTSFLTADVGLFTVGGLVPGQSVLVHAAAGGVGRSAIQLARASGIDTVVATAGSAARQAEAAALGATHVTGYEEFPELVREVTAGRGIDVALESVGGEVFDRTAEVMAPLGRLVTIGASSGTPPRRLKLPFLWQRSVTVGGLHVANLLAGSPDLLEDSWQRVRRLLVKGELDAGVGLVVDRDGIPSAAQALRGRTVSGRVVIDFSARDTRPLP